MRYVLVPMRLPDAMREAGADNNHGGGYTFEPAYEAALTARPAIDAEEVETVARVICVADGLDPSKPVGTQPLPPREGETESMATVVHRQWQMYMPQARAVIAHFGGRIAEKAVEAGDQNVV